MSFPSSTKGVDGCYARGRMDGVGGDGRGRWLFVYYDKSTNLQMGMDGWGCIFLLLVRGGWMNEGGCLFLILFDFF